MMWSSGSGGWWLFALPLMILCMVMMMRMMGHGHGSHGARTGESPAQRPGGAEGDAERILAERLARGEIDIEEYERRLEALRPTGEHDRTKEVSP
jgi:putative membrane protein